MLPVYVSKEFSAPNWTALVALLSKASERLDFQVPYREMLQGANQPEGLAQRLFDILTENGGIAPAWQVQTQLGHMQQLLAEGAGQGEIAVQLGAGAGGHAYHGNQAYALVVQLSSEKPKRYAIDSCLRTFHEHQKHFLLESANSPVWGIYG